MESSSATELLRGDHRTIMRVLDSLEVVAERMARGEEVPVETLREAVIFGQTFVDRCHHGKEELCLFPCLEKRGIPREGGPIGMMLYEHQVGRDLVMRIQAALSMYEEEKTGARELAGLCSEYTTHLRQHILKEEAVLFRMAERVMSGGDHAGSAACYERTEEEKVGREEHGEMLRLADEMESRMREEKDL